jgi:hypothetical protein
VKRETPPPRSFAANPTTSSRQPYEPHAEPEPEPDTSRQQPEVAHDISANHTDARALLTFGQAPAR